MKSRIYSVLIAYALLVIVGCGAARVKEQKIDPSPTLLGQQSKDNTILAEADAIDAISPDAKPHTDKQREAVKAAPAADVVALVDQYIRQDERSRAVIAAQTKENLKLKKDLADAKDSVWRTVQLWGSGLLYVVAIAALVLAAFRAKAAISSGLAIMEGIKSTVTLLTLSATCFTVARFMASWWFWWACGAIMLGFLGYVGYLAVMERKGKAAANALTPIRKVLDRVYDEAAPTVKADLDATIFQPLSDEMKNVPGAKAYIHLDRATA